MDLVIFRNTGPVSGFEKVYDSFVKRVKSNNVKTFNEFTGKADMCGKQYLLDLTLDGFPVIPTIDSVENLNLLGDCETYVIKPKDGVVELEDLNPYLSILELNENLRQKVIDDWINVLKNILE